MLCSADLATNTCLLGILKKIDKNIDKLKPNYSPAFVHKAGLNSLVPGQVFIIWHYSPDLALQPLKRYRKTFGVNKLPENLRDKVAKEICTAINELLKKNINPLDEQINTDIKRTEILINDLNAAHNTILLKIDKQRTVSTYNSLYLHLKKFLKNRQLETIDTPNFSRKIAQEYQNYLIGLELSNKTVNLKIDYAKQLFLELQAIDAIEKNPFEFVKKLKIVKDSLPGLASLGTDKAKIFSREEIIKIKEFLTVQNLGLWNFSLFIYYCFMRPESISWIKRKDLDFDRGLLFIDGKHHKNGKNAYKQLFPEHLKYLKPWCKGMANDDYLFSTKLVPGSTHYAPTRAAEQWREFVKLRLKIDKKMYLLKDTGAIHYLENNPGKENLKWLQMQMSHADLQTTSIYTNKQSLILLDNAKMESF